LPRPSSRPRAGALQALEPSTLIVLQLLAPGGRVVLVGDPCQLPATVISRAASAAALGQSLFERLQKVGGLLVGTCMGACLWGHAWVPAVVPAW
jgi:hypothetical protein